ncbi:MAG: magnesium transporter CorA family protein [Micrococcaceae bacterium]
MITIFDENMKAHNINTQEINAVANKNSALWIHLESNYDYNDFYKVADAYGLHHLAIENITQSFTRSKISRYDDHILITTQIPKITEEFQLKLTEIAIFILKDVIITVLNKEINYGQIIQERLKDQTEIPEHNVEFVLYGVLDCIIDDFLQVAELLDEETENLEASLFNEKLDDSTQKLSFFVHRNLSDLRRVILPMSEVMSSILRWNSLHSADKTTPYFQEVYDHIILAIELTDSSRDMVSSVLQTQIALQSNALNVTMKKVTSWAAIIAVPAGITGFFGMNVPYLGAGQEWGVWLASILLILTVVSLIWGFKKRDWL